MRTSHGVRRICLPLDTVCCEELQFTLHMTYTHWGRALTILRDCFTDLAGRGKCFESLQ